MCGRYAIRIAALESWRHYVDLSAIAAVADSFNVAPTQQVPVARLRGGRPQALMLRWGLVPYHARGVPTKYSTINARVESFETASSYRGPWNRGQRCLQFASGFYEWHLGANGMKRPYYITVADQEVFAFAALWDRTFRYPEVSLEICVHITMPGNELLKSIHNTGAHPFRMPAILTREDARVWLEGTPEEARAVLRPYPSSLMAAHAVSRAVNSPRNNSPELIEPVGNPVASDQDEWLRRYRAHIRKRRPEIADWQLQELASTGAHQTLSRLYPDDPEAAVDDNADFDRLWAATHSDPPAC